MIIASGFIEVNDIKDIKEIAEELKLMNVEVNEIKNEKIVFLIERETPSEMKNFLDSLKDIKGVRNVYLAYYTLEGSDT